MPAPVPVLAPVSREAPKGSEAPKGGEALGDGEPVRGPAMPDRDRLEDAFAAALLDPGRQRPQGVKGPGAKRADKRFDVYRNNVVSSLVGVLADIYPAVHRIVGDGFFRAMARLHVDEEPPRSRLMHEYGAGFPAFLERFEPARAMPYLPDVARIERAWLDAYHAADAGLLDAQALSEVPPEELAETRFIAHPAMRVLRSAHAANTIFAANRAQGDVGPIDASLPEDTLITRPRYEVDARALPPGAAAFLSALRDGVPLGEAAALGAADAEARGGAFDLPANIGGMIASGAFTGLRRPDAP